MQDNKLRSKRHLKGRQMLKNHSATQMQTKVKSLTNLIKLWPRRSQEYNTWFNKKAQNKQSTRETIE